MSGSQFGRRYLGKVRVLFQGCVAFAVLLVSAEAPGANLARVIRRALGVGDDIPIPRLNEVVEESSTSRAGRKVLNNLEGRKAPDAADNLQGKKSLRTLEDLDGKKAPGAVDEAEALQRAWRHVLGNSDPALLREVASLPPETQHAALLLACGGKQLKEAVGDLALRGRLVREGGAEMLATLGRFDDLTDDMIRFDHALKRDKLLSPPGVRGLNLADFGNFFHKLEDRGYRFWTKYVRPHWKLWLGTSALAAVLLAPDEYIDKAGELTLEGLEKIARVGSKLLVRALRETMEGVGDATTEVVTQTTQDFLKKLFTTPWRIASALVLLLGVLLAIGRTRRVMLGCVRWIFRSIRWMLGFILRNVRNRAPANPSSESVQS